MFCVGLVEMTSNFVVFYNFAYNISFPHQKTQLKLDKIV